MVRGKELEKGAGRVLEDDDTAEATLPPDTDAESDDAPAKPKDYEVVIILAVRKKDENGELQEFFSNETTYPNANYGLVVITQQKLMKLERMFGNMGIMMAHKKGFAEELEQFGVELSEEV
jgi:hypothetical protein